MIQILVELVAEYALFLERLDPADVSLEAIVRQQEELGYRLQRLSPTERAAFIHSLNAYAATLRSREEREFLAHLPEAAGME